MTSSNEVINDFASDMAVEIRILGIPTQENAENNDIVKQTAASEILTLQLQGTYSDQYDIACIFVKLNTRTECKN